MGAELSHEERAGLLRLARETIDVYLRDGRRIQPPPAKGTLAEARGAFVTLETDGGRLRGCIGTFVSATPLTETIVEMAISAAVRDPRFPPLTHAELGGVEIEISALTPLREIHDISEIVVGRDGIYITRGVSRGVLLPQVATRYGWSARQFLEETCRKANLPANAWEDPASVIEIFSAEVFSEREVLSE